jgi:hypothetical protein
MTTMTFTAALRDYLTSGENGRPTSVMELKPFLLDKDSRAVYVAELKSYGYEIA